MPLPCHGAIGSPCVVLAPSEIHNSDPLRYSIADFPLPTPTTTTPDDELLLLVASFRPFFFIRTCRQQTRTPFDSSNTFYSRLSTHIRCLQRRHSACTDELLVALKTPAPSIPTTRSAHSGRRHFQLFFFRESRLTVTHLDLPSRTITSSSESTTSRGRSLLNRNRLATTLIHQGNIPGVTLP